MLLFKPGLVSHDIDFLKLQCMLMKKEFEKKSFLNQACAWYYVTVMMYTLIQSGYTWILHCTVELLGLFEEIVFGWWAYASFDWSNLKLESIAYSVSHSWWHQTLMVTVLMCSCLCSIAFQWQALENLGRSHHTSSKRLMMAKSGFKSGPLALAFAMWWQLRSLTPRPGLLWKIAGGCNLWSTCAIRKSSKLDLLWILCLALSSQRKRERKQRKLRALSLMTLWFCLWVTKVHLLHAKPVPKPMMTCTCSTQRKTWMSSSLTFKRLVSAYLLLAKVAKGLTARLDNTLRRAKALRVKMNRSKDFLVLQHGLLWCYGAVRKECTIVFFCCTPSLKLDGQAMMVALLLINHVILVEAIMASHLFQP